MSKYVKITTRKLGGTKRRGGANEEVTTTVVKPAKGKIGRINDILKESGILSKGVKEFGPKWVAEGLEKLGYGKKKRKPKRRPVRSGGNLFSDIFSGIGGLASGIGNTARGIGSAVLGGRTHSVRKRRGGNLGWENGRAMRPMAIKL